MINISREMVNIIRSEDYEAEAGSGSMRGALEMKRGLLRQATKTEEEQVSGCTDNHYTLCVVCRTRQYYLPGGNLRGFQ